MEVKNWNSLVPAFLNFFKGNKENRRIRLNNFCVKNAILKSDHWNENYWAVLFRSKQGGLNLSSKRIEILKA